MTARAFLYATNPSRWRPFLAGPDIYPLPTGDPPPTYPPDYGPYGSYRPSATTAGLPPGATLQQQTGSVNLNTTGQILEDVELHGRVSVTGQDCIIRRCIIHGDGAFGGYTISATNANVRNLLIEDCVLIPSGATGTVTNGIGGHDYTMRRTEIRNMVDAIDPFNTNMTNAPSRITVEGCWFHDFAYYSPDSHDDNQSHNDGAQIQGVSGVVLRGNSIEAYYGSYGTHQPSNTGVTPAGHFAPDLTCVLFNNTTALGFPTDHLFEDNWFMGGAQPINCGGGGAGINLGVMHRNKFSRDSYQPVDNPGHPWTIVRRSDQTLDAGEGTPDQNVYLDGSPILVRTNG